MKYLVVLSILFALVGCVTDQERLQDPSYICPLTCDAAGSTWVGRTITTKAGTACVCRKDVSL